MADFSGKIHASALKGSFLLAGNLFNSNFSVLISSCNFDVEKNSLCVYVRYEYTE
jgi:hypothetical protein